MSDELEYASPDFAWPATEVRKPPPPEKTEKRPISRGQRRSLVTLRQARELARRWEADDDDVTIQDIIDLLLRDGHAG